MKIRDPLYNYLFLTEVEKGILDNPLFQRLRHISQNGAAYYTFPSNHSDRFLHSLGTMEIAGRMMVSVFSNSPEEALDEFYRQCYELVEQCKSHLNEAVVSFERIEQNAIAGDSLEVYRHFGIDTSVLEERVRGKGALIVTGDSLSCAEVQFLRLVVFESVRLAAMLHDLGHFPYSHSLESAFVPESGEDLSSITKCFDDHGDAELNSSTALHERIGIHLLDAVFPAEQLNSFERICRMIARRILKSESSATEEKPIVPLLHSVIASDLDADRMDYCTRDPRFSGMELGVFDLERMTSNIIVIKDGGELKILPHIRALSAIESFYHQRYQVYKYMIYHHSTMRMNELIRYIVHDLAVLYVEKSPDALCEFLATRHFDYLWTHSRDSKYFICTENWLFSLLCDLREDAGSLLVDENASEDVRNRLDRIQCMVDTFVCRLSNNFATLTKRQSEYESLLNDVASKVDGLGGKPVPQIGEIVLAAYSSLGKSIFKTVEEERGVTVMLLKTKPKTILNDQRQIALEVVNEDGRVDAIKPHSAYLASLERCLSEDQQFHLVVFGDGVKSRQDEALESVKRDVVGALADAVKSQY